MSLNQEQSDFLLKVLQLTAFDNCDAIWWRTDEPEYSPFTILVGCNDLFVWASADCERLAPENIGVLEQAIKDVETATGDKHSSNAFLLFCCRVRGMRPQTPYYKYFSDAEKVLFDAAGPKRKMWD